jgi:hypothetical protein
MKREVKVALSASLCALLIVLAFQHLKAAEFFCRSGDVTCLIAAINEANQNGEENRINLEPGTYTLNSVDNEADGPNGLPSVTGTVAILGDESEASIIQRDQGAALLRLIHVASGGRLELRFVTLESGAGRPGGALFNGGKLTMDGTTVHRNFASLRAEAGGLYNVGHAKLEYCMMSENGAFTTGAIRNLGELTIANCTFINNDGGFGTGAIANSGKLMITKSTVADNLSSLAGAFLNSGEASITNSTFALNVDESFPSAIWNSGALTVNNSTIAGNFTFRGPAVFSREGTVTLTNSIIANNLSRVTQVFENCAGTAIISSGHNLFDPSGCTQPAATDILADPRLASFSDDESPGGGHFPLLPDSPAIGSGNRLICPETDQLDDPRVGRCDIGAVEFKGPTALLIVKRDAIRAGRSIRVRWRRIPAPTPTDWIGLYLPGAGDTEFIDWIYVSCSKTPGSPERGGSCDFPVPASIAPGTYELRLLGDDGFTLLATSDGFEVRRNRATLAATQ